MSVPHKQGDEGSPPEIDPSSNMFLALHAFATRLAELTGSGKVEKLVLDTFAEVAKAEQASLAVFEEREGYATIAATRGYLAELVSDIRVKAGEGLLGSVVSSHQPRVIADVGAELGQERRRIRYRTPSCLLVPLMAGGRLLAVLNLADRADRGAFEQADLARLNPFVGPAALALLAGRLAHDKADLAKLVVTDPLTGLFNRRHFTTRLEEEIGRAVRELSNLSVLVVDVDFFKAVNDRFGHAAGDAVLREVSVVIRRSVRSFDVCARMGGDEFVVAIQGSEESALQMAERLRRQVEAWRPGARLPAEMQVTVSIGLASLRPDAPDGKDLLARADRALYAAKLAGRNRLQLER